MNTNQESKISILLSSENLNQTEIRNWVADDRFGGIVIFEGCVRNHSAGKEVVRLEFESYATMAEKEMRIIAEEALSKFDIGKIAIHHRTGVLMIGEIPVIIAAAAAHRGAAFDACEFAIDRLKERVPIWKKEVFEDGEVWVAAHP